MIYEIMESVRLAEAELFNSIDEDGCVDPAIMEKYSQMCELRDEKFEAVVLCNKNDDALLEALKAEIKSLQERAKTLENRIKWRKGFLTSILDGNKFETSKVKVSFRKSDSVVVDDIESLPEMYKKVKIETSADKSAIKPLLKNGQSIAGCHLETSLNIQIK